MRRNAFLVSAILLSGFTGFSAAQNAGLPANAPPLAVSPRPASVPNLPFTADVVTRFERTLDNGQSVVRDTHSRVMRDSQGRVRTETALPNSDKVERITIQDPAQNQVITLDARTNTATIFHPADATGAKTSAVGGTSGSTVIAQNGTGSSTAIHMNSRPLSSAMVSGSSMTSSLGTKTMDGVQVEGTRTKRTAPNGNAGSEAAQSVSETWYSPELKMTMSSDSDNGPRGHSSMRVTSLVRSEPAPQLFQIPADYTIKDLGQGAAGSQP